LPWVIVAAAAPRRLIYAHEFAWDRDRDPVWTRLGRIYHWYEADDSLAFTLGKGSVSGKPPESTHCNNIGAFHRVSIHSAFQRWFGLKAVEVRDRHPANELACLTGESKPRPVHELARDLADQRLAEARRRRAALSSPEAQRSALRQDLARLLGIAEGPARATLTSQTRETAGAVQVERCVLEVEAKIPIPLLVLTSAGKEGARRPVVVALAQQGKQAFLKEQAAELARLVQAGVMVVLPDLRGMGEMRLGEERGRNGAATSLAASERMLGRTLLGAQLGDLRAVLAWLRERADVNPGRIALWGDSFARANPADFNPVVPLDASKTPALSEPNGPLLALVGGLFDERVHAVVSRGGLASFRSVLDSPFLYLPADSVIPGILTVGDIGDVAASLAPRAVRIEAAVDGLNRLSKSTKDKVERTKQLANWLIEQLR
jgi:hypothetical protein